MKYDIIFVEVVMVNKIYFQEENATIICYKTLTTSLIKPESIDLIVTSPPYNLNIDYKSHDDNLQYDEYLKFTKKWLKKCLTLLKKMTECV
mgnify:CR=1 FL=1